MATKAMQTATQFFKVKRLKQQAEIEEQRLSGMLSFLEEAQLVEYQTLTAENKAQIRFNA